jgi:ribosomal protein S18 acetylase RimI-like enzyme
MQIREPSAADLDALMAFFARVPESERTFFKEPVLDRATIESWLTTDSGRRALAHDEDGSVVGYVAVIRLTGWSDHVGEVRLVVDPGHRGQGLGRALARWALLQAVDCGLAKLTVEVVAEQEGAVAMFTGLGFQAEALLRDHVRDRDGELRDLVVLSHSVADAWSAMETAGIDDALA